MLDIKKVIHINLIIQLLAFIMRDKPCMVELEKTSAVISFSKANFFSSRISCDVLKPT
jgi:3-deoxy-D-manno-octulosonic acid (KDO) 8-phosphate synthase